MNIKQRLLQQIFIISLQATQEKIKLERAYQQLRLIHIQKRTTLQTSILLNEILSIKLESKYNEILKKIADLHQQYAIFLQLYANIEEDLSKIKHSHELISFQPLVQNPFDYFLLFRAQQLQPIMEQMPQINQIFIQLSNNIMNEEEIAKIIKSNIKYLIMLSNSEPSQDQELLFDAMNVICQQYSQLQDMDILYIQQSIKPHEIYINKDDVTNYVITSLCLIFQDPDQQIYFSIHKLLYFNWIHGILDILEPMETIMGNHDVLVYILNSQSNSNINNPTYLLEELQIYLEYYIQKKLNKQFQTAYQIISQMLYLQNLDSQLIKRILGTFQYVNNNITQSGLKVISEHSVFYNQYHNDLVERIEGYVMENESLDVLVYQQIMDITNVIKLGDFGQIKLIVIEYLSVLSNIVLLSLSSEIIKIILLVIMHFEYKQDECITDFVKSFSNVLATARLNAQSKRLWDYIHENYITITFYEKEEDKSISNWLHLYEKQISTKEKIKIDFSNM